MYPMFLLLLFLGNRALRWIPTYIWPSTFHAPRPHVSSATVTATAFLQKDRVVCIGVLVPSRGLRGYVSFVNGLASNPEGLFIWRSSGVNPISRNRKRRCFKGQSLAGPSGGSYSLWRSATITFCESSLPHQSGIRPCGHAHSILALITLSGSGFESAYLLYLPLKSQTLCDFECVLEISGSRTPKKIAISIVRE